jgi:hypothetical protein
MGYTRSRSGILVCFAAAVGAFGAAAMMSAATAPTARADDFTDIINAVDGDYAEGQAAFTIAFSDFGGDQFVPGVAELIAGVDDDSLAVTNNILVGTVEALEGDPINGSGGWGFAIPATYADAVSEAQSIFTSGETFLADATSEFASADYVDAVSSASFGLEYVTIAPLEELLLGAAVSF